MKVLLSAYACEPGKGSEPGSGWNWVRSIGRFNECWVITRQNNRPEIERALLLEPMSRVHFAYYDLPRWCSFWKKGQRGIRAYYFFWQVGAYRLAKQLHRETNFDLVHHLTFASYWLPTLLAFLPIPFVWGPVGGAESAPKTFLKAFGFRGALYEFVRQVARTINEVNPLVRRTARRAAVAYATTQETGDRLRILGCRDVSLVSQAALTQEELDSLSAIPMRAEAPFRALSIGRLLHWKGFEFGLRAFAEFHGAFPTSEYWVIGEGPEDARLQNLAKSLGIQGHVMFWGRLDRTDVLKKIAACDVLVHPSFHDSSGWVTVEAMASGRPVICLDLGGPALQVTQNTGIKVPADRPQQVISDLATALYKLASDPGLRFRLSVGAKKRAKADFNWNNKGLLMTKLYESLCADKQSETVAVGKLA